MWRGIVIDAGGSGNTRQHCRATPSKRNPDAGTAAAAAGAECCIFIGAEGAWLGERQLVNVSSQQHITDHVRRKWQCHRGVGA